MYEALSSVIDFSNFSKDHKYYDASRMNMLGYWKDEMHGRDIMEFAGAAAKSYALRVCTGDDDDDDAGVGTEDDAGDSSGGGERGHRAVTEVTKCKGVARGACKSIPFAAWKDAVLKGTARVVTQYTIMSKDHKIKTIGTDKVAVSPFDDKR